MKKTIRSCVTPGGKFKHIVHTPNYKVSNLRTSSKATSLGRDQNEREIDNSSNFPQSDVQVNKADLVYEIANPFPFRGATFITHSWAQSRVQDPKSSIALPPAPETSMTAALQELTEQKDAESCAKFFKKLPQPVLLSLAANSTDPNDLTAIAALCCEFIFNDKGQLTGLRFNTDGQGRSKPIIKQHMLFEIVANNPYLPDKYKEVMVLRPGAQGGSEIVGEIDSAESHIFEYLRRNSYIPWGHYAANMANDSIRYSLAELSIADINGLRHLYYQRTYIRTAEMLDIPVTPEMPLTDEALETLRCQIVHKLQKNPATELAFNSTLWGWNYGFDCAASEYRLHASHQMIHQQFAMLPSRPNGPSAPSFSPYGCGDLIADFITDYQQQNGSLFFDDYLAATQNNQRLDGRQDLANSLIVYSDAHVILFVPKAQTSQWELQLMTIKEVGNILEADSAIRTSLNTAMHKAMRILTNMGARMISTIEFSKRFLGGDPSQRLLYSFLPKLPYSPGAFSEAQLRWINGHFPEDFARACRDNMPLQNNHPRGA